MDKQVQISKDDLIGFVSGSLGSADFARVSLAVSQDANLQNEVAALEMLRSSGLRNLAARRLGVAADRVEVADRRTAIGRLRIRLAGTRPLNVVCAGCSGDERDRLSVRHRE